MRRIVIATVGSFVLFAILLAFLVPTLPEPVAIHFGIDRTADGFGSRNSVWAVGRSQPGLSAIAVVTRSGPALELSRTDGSTVEVSLDHPDEAAAVVNALLDRRAGPDHVDADDRPAARRFRPADGRD